MRGIHSHIVTQIVILTFFSPPSHTSLKRSNVEHKICQKYKTFSKLEHLENVRLFKPLTSRLIVNNLSFSDDKKIAVVSRFLKQFLKNSGMMKNL